MDAEFLADDPRFVTLKERVAHMDLIDAAVSDWTSAHPTAWLFDKLMAAHVPCSPVRTLDEVINDENMHARGALTWIDHPEYGRMVVQQSPFNFEGVPRVSLRPSRPLGADTREVLGEIAVLDEAVISEITQS